MPTTTQTRAIYNRQPASPISYDTRVSQFNPTIWLDEFSTFYQDAGTTPADGAGEVVGRWADRSGNNLHANAVGSARPPLVDVDGVLLPDLDGTNHTFTIANNTLWANQTQWTVLARVRADSAGGGNGYLWAMADTSGETALRFEGALTSLRLAVGNTGGMFTTTSGVSVGADVWLWATVRRTASIPLLRNPVRFAGAPMPMQNSIGVPDGNLRIGSDDTPANYFDGQYRALIVFPSILSALNMRWIMNGAA